MNRHNLFGGVLALARSIKAWNTTCAFALIVGFSSFALSSTPSRAAITPRIPGLVVENSNAILLEVSPLFRPERYGLTDRELRTKCELRIRQAGLTPISPEEKDLLIEKHHEISRALRITMTDTPSVTSTQRSRELVQQLKAVSNRIPDGRLRVGVDMGVGATAILITFERIVFCDVGADTSATYATTWMTNHMVEYDYDQPDRREVVLRRLDSSLDSFINDYLEMNTTR
jgi:hypothetical protein